MKIIFILIAYIALFGFVLFVIQNDPSFAQKKEVTAQNDYRVSNISIFWESIFLKSD